ncbi:MAG: hypothetical protein JO227_05815 [Acetobacteraceae bacterium]|nr:hypothetical protein [Acetobacteraceae bacterium]
MLKARGNDVCQQHFLAGATWTILGQAPTSGAGNPVNQVSTSLVENATRENLRPGCCQRQHEGRLGLHDCHRAKTAAPNWSGIGVSFISPAVSGCGGTRLGVVLYREHRHE